MGDAKSGYQATPPEELERQVMEPSFAKNEREWWALNEITRLRAEVEALRGITPELPPRPPEGGGLPRYGLRHNGQSMPMSVPMSVPMSDGYWTPYHLAIAEVEALKADVADAARYRFMLIDIDTAEFIDKKGRGNGYYWHNQRGYFNYEIEPGKERPTFESLIDAARAAQEK